MAKIRVNLNTTVNSKKIRRETVDGRDYLIVPSYTLPHNVVMNRGLYPASEIDAHFRGLEGTLAPNGHPTLNGEFISAFSPEGINGFHIGAFNRNVKKSGNRIYVEKWIDVKVANQTEAGKAVVERIEALERDEDVPPIHTSVALFLEQLPAEDGADYDWIAKINAIDHDAILLHEVGAATPEQGVGMMVNADKAEPILRANAGVFPGESFRDQETALNDAAQELFVKQSGKDYAWVADFDSSMVVVVVSGEGARVYDYKRENGKIVIESEGREVVRKESWIASMAANLRNIFSNHQARPDPKTQEGDMPITKEERAELVADLKEALGPELNSIKANQETMAKDLESNRNALADLSSAMTANSRADEAKKREAVGKHLGEVVANALSGEALDEAFRKCGSANFIKPEELSANRSKSGAPTLDDHFGGAQ